MIESAQINKMGSPLKCLRVILLSIHDIDDSEAVKKFESGATIQNLGPSSRDCWQ